MEPLSVTQILSWRNTKFNFETYNITLIDSDGECCGFWNLEDDCPTWFFPGHIYLGNSRELLDNFIRESVSLKAYAEKYDYKIVITASSAVDVLEVVK